MHGAGGGGRGAEHREAAEDERCLKGSCSVESDDGRSHFDS